MTDDSAPALAFSPAVIAKANYSTGGKSNTIYTPNTGEISSYLFLIYMNQGEVKIICF